MPSEEEFRRLAKQELNYDAWGRLRDPATHVAYAQGSEPALFLGRGYTGHEHLTWFGLVNMNFAVEREQDEKSIFSIMPSVSKEGEANARLYDPVLGRFLSPDPYVQAPDNTQNFNRYSYCLNNPLMYSDPNGESFILVAAIIGGWMGMGQAMVSSNNHGKKLAIDMLKGLFIGAISGAAGAGAGVLTQGLQVFGAIPGALIEGSIQGTIGGLTGGLGNVLIENDWKSFGKGFAQGFITGFILGGISGGIEGYKNAQSVGANPWSGRLYQNETTFSATLKDGIPLQPDPERDCYGHVLEYADNGHGNRQASYFISEAEKNGLAKNGGAFVGDVARKSDIKVNWSKRISGVEWNNVGGSLKIGKEILGTTSRNEVSHWVNITSITTADKWKIVGGGWKRVLRSTSVWDPISGHIKNGPISFYSILSLF